MKRPVYLILLVLFALLHQSCVEQEDLQTEKVQFTLTAADLNISGGEIQSLTNAEASLYKNGIKQHNYSLGSGKNQLSFEGDPNAVYTLIVKSDGYIPLARQLSYADMMTSSGERSLTFKLEPVNSRPVFTIMPTGDFSFTIAMKESGSITVDWGDGTVETTEFSATELDPKSFRTMVHDYATNPYPILVTGDIDKIVEYHNEYYVYYSILEDINTTHLPALTHLFFFDCAVGKLDLSRNENLRYVGIHDNSIEHLKLPKQHYMEYAIFTATKLTKPHATDALIDNVYENAVARRITDGYFGVAGMEPPPSAASMEKLNTLAELYRWTVSAD